MRHEYLFSFNYVKMIHCAVCTVKLDDKDTPRRSDNDEVIRQLFEKLMQSADEATGT